MVYALKISQKLVFGITNEAVENQVRLNMEGGAEAMLIKTLETERER